MSNAAFFLSGTSIQSMASYTRRSFYIHTLLHYITSPQTEYNQRLLPPGVYFTPTLYSFSFYYYSPKSLYNQRLLTSGALHTLILFARIQLSGSYCGGAVSATVWAWKQKGSAKNTDDRKRNLFGHLEHVGFLCTVNTCTFGAMVNDYNSRKL